MRSAPSDPSNKHRRLARYTLALAAVGAAFLARLLLTAWVGPGLATYITFYPAVMAVALLGGFGPGLLATAATVLVTDCWVLLPLGFGAESLADAVGLAIFSGMGVFMSVVAELYRRARQRAASYEKELALRESQEEVRRQREWLRVTLSSIGDAVLATDTAGRVTFLNPVAQSLTGWPEQEALGQPVQAVFHIINEETRAPAEDIVAHVLRDGQIVALANHTALLARDGREIPIEDSAAPIKDGAGHLTGAVLVFHDVAEKRRDQEALRASEARLKRSQEIAHLGGWELDLKKNHLTWSDEVYRIFGLQPQEFPATYEAFLEAVHPEDRQAVDAAYSGSLRDGKDSYQTEHRVLQRGTGQIRWVHEKCAHVRDAAGRTIRSVGMVHDITERKQTEEALRKVNRTLNALKESSQAMMRATSEPDYLQEICKIVVQDCGHAMVWIGYAEDNEARSIRPVASSGFEEGYLETLKLTWADTERGCGPTGIAVRTGKSSFCRNMLSDPRFEPWRAEALKRGYASSIALPLLANGRAFGAITIYSRQPDPFSEDEQKLLADLAGDLAYGIQALRLRAAKAAAEEQLQLLSTAVVSAVNGIAITDRKGLLLWVNPAFATLTGYSSTEVVGQNPRLLKSGRHSPDFYRQLWTTILRGEPWHGEMVNRRKDGSSYTEEMTIAPVRAGGTDITHFVAIKQDVTERKRAEMRTDLLAETASQLLTTDFPKRIIESLCQKVLAFLDCQVFINFLADEEQQRLHLNACAGLPREEASKIESLDFGVALSGCAARDGCPIVAENVQATSDPRTELVKSNGIQAYACHPLMVGGRLLGTLSFGTRTRAHFTDEELSVMKAVADQVAIAMDRQRAQEILRRINEELEQRVAARTAEVQESEARYRSLVTATSQIVWTTNTRGEIVTDLPTWQAFTGQTFEQYQGSGWTEVVHPEDRERTTAAWSNAVATRSSYETEYRMRRHDGQYRFMLARGVPVLEADTTVREWVGTCTDTTERKEAERRREFTTALLGLFARKSLASDYLNSVVEIIRQLTGCQALGLRVKNEQQEIPYESWAGFEPGFLKLEHCLSLQHDQCLCIRAISEDFEDQDQSLLTRGGSFRADDAISFAKRLPPQKLARYRGNCMKFGFASLAVIPIRYREEIVGAIHLADRRLAQFPLALVEFIESTTPLIGEALHRFQTEAELSRHRDHLEVLVQQRTSELEASNARLQSEIAERQRAQETLQQTAEELKRSNHDLEQFAYVASHDLQEPLRAVGGYVKLLQRRFPENVDPKAKEFIAGACDGAARMERLITDLLAFSRVGTRGGAFAVADLNAVLNNALCNLQGSIKSAQATVTCDSLPTLSVDATQILQLFQNLIGNAMKFRGERPSEIRVGARPEQDRWIFWVRDNGIGIESQYFERIFQIFQRLHTRKYYPGTGIGLAICKKIVERHGGVIWVESQPEQGSTFYFSIPGTSGTRGASV